MIQKQFYEAPEAELFEISFEDRFLDGTLRLGGAGRTNYEEEIDLDAEE